MKRLNNYKLPTALLLVFAVTLLALQFQSCEKNDEEQAKISFRLIDAPGNFDEVNIDIQAIELKIDSATINWTVFNPGVYNILDLVNGLDTLLASGSVDPGKLSQIRLILGTNNTVMVDSVVYPLSTPSAQQSGLKLNVHYDILAGIIYEFTLDFDAAHSIVKTGNNNYKLKPVIKVFTDATTGAISGLAYPALSSYAVDAVIGPDTFGTVPDPATGGFLIPGLAPGTYDVVIYGNAPYQDSIIPSVNVVKGSVTDLDTVFM